MLAKHEPFPGQICFEVYLYQTSSYNSLILITHCFARNRTPEVSLPFLDSFGDHQKWPTRIQTAFSGGKTPLALVSDSRRPHQSRNGGTILTTSPRTRLLAMSDQSQQSTSSSDMLWCPLYAMYLVPPHHACSRGSPPLLRLCQH